MALQHNFGIDFGTTNSSVVRMVSLNGVSRPIPYGDDEGRPIPSIVAIDKATGEVHTGRDAWNRRVRYAQTCECIPSVKSVLDDENWSRTIAGKTWHAKDVAREVFKKLRQTVHDADSGTDMERATVAVPIGFNAHKRENLRQAAHEAGIEIESFVSEPTAAFFANYQNLKDMNHVVIFDWGGGTLDVSVLRHQGGTIEELATAGMQKAGDDIDLALALKIHAKVVHDKGQHIAFEEMPPADQDMLLVRAERAKRALSEEDDTVVSLNRYGELGAIRVRVTYEWFESIVSSIVSEAIGCLDRAINLSGEPESNIDCIVMVGGSSNIGPLYDRLSERFGDKLLYPEETVWNISQGAALLSKNPGTYRTAQDVAIVLADGSRLPLLSRGEKVAGWHRSITFGLVDTSNEARIVFTGSGDIDSSASKYAVVSVPSYGFLEERLRLDCEVDKDRIFKATMTSTMRPRDDKRVWTYDKLLMTYSLQEAVL